MQNLNLIIRNKVLITLLCVVTLTVSGCKKDISEPEHKNKGCNVVYVKLDDQEYLIKEKRFSFNKKNKMKIQGSDYKDSPDFDQSFISSSSGQINFYLKFSSMAKNKDEEIDGVIALRLNAGNLDLIKEHDSLVKLLGISNKYSEKIDADVRFRRDSTFQNLKLKIEKLDREEKIISGNISFDYLDNDNTRTGQAYIYFDVKF